MNNYSNWCDLVGEECTGKSNTTILLMSGLKLYYFQHFKSPFLGYFHPVDLNMGKNESQLFPETDMKTKHMKCNLSWYLKLEQ